MATRESLPLEGLLVHRRWTVAGALAVLVGLGWVYLLAMVADHGDAGSLGLGMEAFGSGLLRDIAAICATGVERFGMPTAVGPWGAADLGLVLVMWLVMTFAMMLPTAAPMILTFTDVAANRLEGAALMRRASAFVGGYLVVWAGFCVAATGAQWALHATALTTPGLVVASPWLAGGLLLFAAAYQFTPLKDLCLTACRNPMTWLFGYWRNGDDGAFRMGLQHGAHCLGCCWALMLVMLVAGVMNLAWVALLSALMLAEKVLPKGDLVGRVAGVLLGAWGLALLLTA